MLVGLVFTNDGGAPIEQHPFSVVFGAARDRAGLPQWATPHALRHYYASLDVQGHLWPDDEDRTRRAVDDAFADPVQDRLRTADGR